MHGIARQFDDEGRELYRTRFVRGSGVDIWVQGGAIVELREFENSLLHGVERWGHPLLPYEEHHFVRGKQAGVARRWVGEDLEKGWPRYYLDDDEVSLSEYRLARKARPELPEVRRCDDSRERPLHRKLLCAWIRMEVRASLSRKPGSDEQFGCGAPEPPAARDRAGRKR